MSKVWFKFILLRFYVQRIRGKETCQVRTANCVVCVRCVQQTVFCVSGAYSKLCSVCQVRTAKCVLCVRCVQQSVFCVSGAYSKVCSVCQVRTAKCVLCVRCVQQNVFCVSGAYSKVCSVCQMRTEKCVLCVRCVQQTVFCVCQVRTAKCVLCVRCVQQSVFCVSGAYSKLCSVCFLQLVRDTPSAIFRTHYIACCSARSTVRSCSRRGVVAVVPTSQRLCSLTSLSKNICSVEIVFLALVAVDFFETDRKRSAAHA
jgi:hypothetical protein